MQDCAVESSSSLSGRIGGTIPYATCFRPLSELGAVGSASTGFVN